MAAADEMFTFCAGILGLLLLVANIGTGTSLASYFGGIYLYGFIIK